MTAKKTKILFMGTPDIAASCLSALLEDILPDEADGHHGSNSQRNTRWLQEVAGLEQTGIMDRFTWNALVSLYELFVLRRRELRADLG